MMYLVAPADLTAAGIDDLIYNDQDADLLVTSNTDYAFSYAEELSSTRARDYVVFKIVEVGFFRGGHKR